MKVEQTHGEEMLKQFLIAAEESAKKMITDDAGVPCENQSTTEHVAEDMEYDLEEKSERSEITKNEILLMTRGHICYPSQEI